jgi:lipoate-protein ligase A
MLDELQVYDDVRPNSAALNMAVDEALLETAATPLLRFYRWQRPSISFGYFGRYSEVADQSGDRDFVRRWTGGGIVPHGEDVTYSVILPASHPWLARSSLEIYAEIHEAILHALQANGVEAILANSAGPKVSEDCFANPVRADVLSEGHKIAGAAHRRSRAGLLHQGSIQRGDLPRQFRNDLARFLGKCCEPMTPSPDVLERAATIAAVKYRTTEWLTRR